MSKPKPTKPPAKPKLTIREVTFYIESSNGTTSFSYDTEDDSTRCYSALPIPTDVAEAMAAAAKAIRRWQLAVELCFNNAQPGHKSGCGDAS